MPRTNCSLIKDQSVSGDKPKTLLQTFFTWLLCQLSAVFRDCFTGRGALPFACAHLTAALKTKIVVSLGSFIIFSAASIGVAQTASLVSINKDGTGSSNGLSAYTEGQTITNGRLIVFTSSATNLVSHPDTNEARDVFVRDLKTGVTSLVSVNASGIGTGNGISGVRPSQSTSSATISRNGRFVAFTSAASDLVANDTNAKDDAFVRDLETGTTFLVSDNSAGTTSGNNASFFPFLSADGSIVAFSSLAADLVPNDTNNTTDVFVRNLQTGVTTLVSKNSTGTSSGNAASNASTMSADGQLIAFSSKASNLVVNDSNGTQRDVFVRNLQTDTITLVSASVDGTGSGNLEARAAIISEDGQSVVFMSRATNLVTGRDTNGTDDIFVRHLATGTTSLVSVNKTGTGTGGVAGSYILSSATISASGNIIAFTSESPDLVDNDADPLPGFSGSDVFVRDVAAGTTRLVSVNGAGTRGGNLDSGTSNVEVSADGRFVVFESSASDLVPNDVNTTQDIFVRDLQRSKTTLVSVNLSGTRGGNDSSFVPAISPDGSVVAFFSDATDLAANDANNVLDVFAFALAQPGSIQFSAPAYTAAEGQATATITVTRTGGSSGAVSAALTTSNGTANAGQDYTAVNQVVTFADGDAAGKTITILITDDALVESAETINLTLSNPTGGQSWETLRRQL